jgi:hypothetical protein
MWHDFDAIPEAVGPRQGVGSMLIRLYRDIGLAAVADAVGLSTADVEDDLARSVERGQPYLLALEPAGLAA